jgi:hypothetical protein
MEAILAAPRADRRVLSLNERYRYWDVEARKLRLPNGRPVWPAHEISKELKRIRKSIARIGEIVPSSTWRDDAVHLRHDRGGAFPPGGDETRMVIARGEECYYPPGYITTSGHSFDVYVQSVYGDKKTQVLADDEVDAPDGYMGSTVSVHDLPRVDREWYREADRAAGQGKGREISGVGI